ncbi:MAG: GGDEF domain-containing protein [Treponema sp.]|nr:GGDEF domain-containing protein [Treponema sp.]
MSEQNLGITEIEIEYARLKERYVDLMIRADYMEQYFNAMVYGSLFAYEIDATEDKLISIPDLIADMYKCRKNSSYNALLKLLCRDRVSETDCKVVYDTVSREAILKAYRNGSRQISIDYLGKGKEDRLTWFQNRLFLIQHPVSGNIHAIVTIKDVQKEKMRDLNLQKRAQEDALTQLANRSYMEEQIRLALQENNDFHCLMLLDIDNFKLINDTFGHQTGDEVLKTFSKMLISKFRKGDIIARLGGDEFLVFMKNANPAIVEPRTKSILESCKTLMGSDSKIKISPSIGISFFPEHGVNFDSLYKNADIALYSSKQKGKNTYTIFSGKIIE